MSPALTPLAQTVQYGIAWGTSNSALETHFEHAEAERRRDWLNDPERMDRLIERGYELPVRVIERDVIPEVVGPWREQLIECPHWEPGRITLRRGCSACAATTGTPDLPTAERHS